MEETLLRYKNRLIDLSTRNRALVLKKLYSKRSFDIKVLDDFYKDKSLKVLEFILKRNKEQTPIKLLDSPYLDKFSKNEKEKAIILSKNLKHLKAEIELVEKEKGSYDLYIGYLFTEGQFLDKTFVRAPLLLFPVKIFEFDGEWFLANNIEENIQINKTFVMAFQQYNQLKIQDFELEFEDLTENFSVDWLIKYLFDNQIKINNENNNDTIIKFKDYTSKDTPSYKQGDLFLKFHLILGQFPVSNSSLNEDYKKLLDILPKHGLVHELLQQEIDEKESPNTYNENQEDKKIIVEEKNAFFLTDTDFSQEKAVFLSKKNNQVVVYGPPGTGKSQVIVNMIADNLANNKKVLMVSQKRAALDVVYNRLAQFSLHERVGFVHDYNKDWNNVFQKVLSILEEQDSYYANNSHKKFLELSEEIESNLYKLEQIAELLHRKTQYGLTLFMLYSKSKNDTTKYIDVLFHNFNMFEKFNNEELGKTLENIDNIVKYLKFDFKNYLLSLRNDFSHFPEIEKNKIIKITQDFLESQSKFLDAEENYNISLNSTQDILENILQISEKASNEIVDLTTKTKDNSLNLLTNFKEFFNKKKDFIQQNTNIFYNNTFKLINVLKSEINNKSPFIKEKFINYLNKQINILSEKTFETFKDFKKRLSNECNILGHKIQALTIYIDENFELLKVPNGFLPLINYSEISNLKALCDEIKSLKIYNLKYWKIFFAIKKIVKNLPLKEIFIKLEHTLQIKKFIDKLNSEFPSIELSYVDNCDTFIKKVELIRNELNLIFEQANRMEIFHGKEDHEELNKKIDSFPSLKNKIFKLIPTFDSLNNQFNVLTAFNKILLELSNFSNFINQYNKDYETFNEPVLNPILEKNCKEISILINSLNEIVNLNNEYFKNFSSSGLINLTETFVQNTQNIYKVCHVSDSLVNNNLGLLNELELLLKEFNLKGQIQKTDSESFKGIFNTFKDKFIKLITTFEKYSFLNLEEINTFNEKKNNLQQLIALIVFYSPSCNFSINKCLKNSDELYNFLKFVSTSHSFSKEVSEFKANLNEFINLFQKLNFIENDEISNLIEKEGFLIEFFNIIYVQAPNFNLITSNCIEKTNTLTSFLNVFSTGNLNDKLFNDETFYTRSFEEKTIEFKFHLSEFINSLKSSDLINIPEISSLIDKEKELTRNFIVIKNRMAFYENTVVRIEENFGFYFKNQFIDFLKSTFLKDQSKFFNITNKIKNEIDDNFSNIKVFDQLKNDSTINEKILLGFCLETFGENENKLQGSKDALTNTFYLKWIDEIEAQNQKILQNLSLEKDLRVLTKQALKQKKDFNLKCIIDTLNKSIDNGKSYNRLGNDVTYKDMKYEASKKRKRMTLRKYVKEFYSKGLFNILPCWLVTPEVASAIFPFNQELFDIVIFDEASQMFVEQGIPALYRAKKAVIAGDDKQLQPNDLYKVRIEEEDSDKNEEDEEYQDTSNLEVKSLLDLAKVKYKSSTLTYHYRALFEELINFSNYAFYDGKIQIIPNRKDSSIFKPIERIIVDGKWVERKNEEEAKTIVNLVKQILMTRENDETIGIITFNSTQKDLILDLLDNEVQNDIGFREVYVKEINRRNGDEDISLFVKNIENVQGDERDIIIFSVGYAKNELGKVVTRFGSLNQDGGENRLNVAISRAKHKIYLITSIEPEELNVENSKNIGPKLFKKYLQYARAISDNNKDEVKSLLNAVISKSIGGPNNLDFDSDFENQVYDELTKLGYEVHAQVGASGYKIDLAIYDRKKSEYILGVECDGAMYHSSKSARERDIYRQKFLESRGWKIHRIWSRDWWKNPSNEINKIEFVLNGNKPKSDRH